MKKLLILLAVTLLSLQAQAQYPLCDTIPLGFIESNIQFNRSQFVGDSVIIIPMVNLSTTGFAYPLARLEPQTPLPTGMSLHPNSEWSVFASAWNPGDTMPARIEYYVNNPIPDNYTVTFKLLVSNLAPLPYDTCMFSSTFQYNLKPTVVSTQSLLLNNRILMYPNPAKNQINISSKEIALFGHLEIVDYLGRSAYNQALNGQNNLEIQLQGLPSPAIYFLQIRSEKGELLFQQRLQKN